MLVMRIKLLALSQIRYIEDSVKKNPMAYRKDTIEYCEAMHAIIEAMSMARLTLYQTEIGEETIYDIGWTSYLEDYFRVRAAIA